MTRRYRLPILVAAALLASVAARAATVTLTDTWQNLNTTGSQLLQVTGGDALVEASASAPTDSGLALFKNQTAFPYNASTTIWAKRRAPALNDAGQPIVTSLTTTPIAAAGGGGGGGSSTITSTVAPSDTRSTFSLDATKTSGTGSFYDVTLNGQGLVGLKFAGLTASGATVTYFSSNDATATPASPISALNAATGVVAGTRTTDGETRIPISGRTTLRLQVTTAGTGTITGAVNVAGVSVSGIVDLGSPLVAQTVIGKDIGAVEQFGAPWSFNQTQVGGITLGSPTNYGTAPTGPVAGTNAFVTNFPATQAVSWASAQPINNQQWAGVTLGAPTNYGTAPSGAVPGMNAFVTNFPATQVVSWATAQPINNQQWAGATLGAPTNYGTAPTGAVPGTNAFVTNFPATQATKPATTATLSTSQASITTTASNASAAGTFVHRGIRSFASNTTPIYYGQTSAVTATTGQRLDPGDYASFDSYSGDIYMIAPSGTATVGVDTN